MSKHSFPRTVTVRKLMHISELKQCDVVELADYDEHDYHKPVIPQPRPWHTMVVKKIDMKADTVTFWRPFAVLSDYEHSGGVSCSTGIEEFSAYRSHSGLYYYVHERREYIEGDWTETKKEDE